MRGPMYLAAIEAAKPPKEYGGFTITDTGFGFYAKDELSEIRLGGVDWNIYGDIKALLEDIDKFNEWHSAEAIVSGKPLPWVLFKCENCGWRIREDDVTVLGEVDDLAGRVYRNDPVPAGECPECEFLIYAPHDEGVMAKVKTIIGYVADQIETKWDDWIDQGVTSNEACEDMEALKACKWLASAYDAPDAFAIRLDKIAKTYPCACVHGPKGEHEPCEFCEGKNDE